MHIDEVEVWVTPDGHGRAAIVRRSDGHFCIYRFWSWRNWLTDDIPISELYEEKIPQSEERFAQPEIGIYGTVQDARREIPAISGFEDAVLKSNK